MFHLKGFVYPINPSSITTLLKMSDKSDDEIHQLKVTMSGKIKTKIAQCRKDVVRHNKGFDKPLSLRYVERDDDQHNLV